MEDTKIKIVKPRLESNIWVRLILGRDRHNIYFFKSNVIAIGKGLFITSDAIRSDVVDEIKEPLYFEDYKVTWFKSLKEIREVYGDIIRESADEYRVPREIL